MHRFHKPAKPNKTALPSSYNYLKNQAAKDLMKELVSVIDSINEKIHQYTNDSRVAFEGFVSDSQSAMSSALIASLSGIGAARSSPAVPRQQLKRNDQEIDKLKKRLRVIERALSKVSDNNVEKVKAELSDELAKLDDPVAQLQKYLSK